MRGIYPRCVSGTTNQSSRICSTTTAPRLELSEIIVDNVCSEVLVRQIFHTHVWDGSAHKRAFSCRSCNLEVFSFSGSSWHHVEEDMPCGKDEQGRST